jgi:hypothetical protein
VGHEALVICITPDGQVHHLGRLVFSLFIRLGCRLNNVKSVVIEEERVNPNNRFSSRMAGWLSGSAWALYWRRVRSTNGCVSLMWIPFD